METIVFNNADLHFEHKQWRSELNFWEDELRTFNHRLEELVNRYTDKELLRRLEHFQNEFILHKGRIDAMLEEIEEHEIRISGQSKKAESMDVPMVNKHRAFRYRMETQREVYAALKKEFFHFLSEYM